MADVGSVTNFNSSLPNPLSTLSNVMSIANTAQQNQLLQTANQQRQFELHKQQNDAINSIIGPLATIPDLDAKSAQNIILPQLRALGIDPATSPVAAQHVGPLLDGTLDDPKKMKLWQAGHTAPFLGAGGFSPTAGPTQGGAPTTELPIQRAARGTPVPIGITPGETTEQTAGTGAGIVEKNADLATSANYLNNKVPYQKIISILHKGGPTLQGLGTEELDTLKNYAVGVGALPPGATMDVEQLRKYYQRTINNNSVGATDFARAGAVTGNPNLKLNTAPAAELAKIDYSLLRAAQVRTLELKNIPAAQYPAARADFNSKQDLNAYGFDMMGGAQQHKYISSLFPAKLGVGQMSDQQRALFLKSVSPNQFPAYDKFRNSLELAHKYNTLDLNLPD